MVIQGFRNISLDDDWSCVQKKLPQFGHFPEMEVCNRCHFPMKPFSSMSLVGLCVHYCFLSIFISLDMTQHYAALIGLTLNGLLQCDRQARNQSCWRLRITPGRPSRIQIWQWEKPKGTFLTNMGQPQPLFVYFPFFLTKWNRTWIARAHVSRSIHQTTPTANKRNLTGVMMCSN